MRTRSQPDSALLALGIASAIGAAAIGWFIEPSRRAAARERMSTAARVVRGRASALRSNATETTSAFRQASDREIERRIRRRLKRVSSHPSLITVHCLDGIATLYGDVLEAEIDGIVTSVAVVPGVREVHNQLELHERADIPGLREEERALPLDEPDLRLLGGVAGAALITYGAWRRDVPGALFAIAGGACVLSALGRERLQSATSLLQQLQPAAHTNAAANDFETREERSFEYPKGSSEPDGGSATRH